MRAMLQGESWMANAVTEMITAGKYTNVGVWAADLAGVESIDQVDEAGLEKLYDALSDKIAVDGDKVTLKLDASFPATLGVIALPFSTSIVDKEWTVDHGGWPGTADTWKAFYKPQLGDGPLFADENGTGPFMLEEWNQSEKRVVLKRFNGYYSEPAALEQVVIRTVPEWTTRRLQARSRRCRRGRNAGGIHRRDGQRSRASRSPTSCRRSMVAACSSPGRCRPRTTPRSAAASSTARASARFLRRSRCAQGLQLRAGLPAADRSGAAGQDRAVAWADGARSDGLSARTARSTASIPQRPPSTSRRPSTANCGRRASPLPYTSPRAIQPRWPRCRCCSRTSARINPKFRLLVETQPISAVNDKLFGHETPILPLSYMGWGPDYSDPGGPLGAATYYLASTGSCCRPRRAGLPRPDEGRFRPAARRWLCHPGPSGARADLRQAPGNGLRIRHQPVPLGGLHVHRHARQHQRLCPQTWSSTVRRDFSTITEGLIDRWSARRAHCPPSPPQGADGAARLFPAFGPQIHPPGDSRTFNYILRRLLFAPVVLFALTLMIFSLQAMLSPMQRLAAYAPSADFLKGGNEQAAALIEKYGLDDPIWNNMRAGSATCCRGTGLVGDRPAAGCAGADGPVPGYRRAGAHPPSPSPSACRSCWAQSAHLSNRLPDPSSGCSLRFGWSFRPSSSG